MSKNINLRVKCIVCLLEYANHCNRITQKSHDHLFQKSGQPGIATFVPKNAKTSKVKFCHGYVTKNITLSLKCIIYIYMYVKSQDRLVLQLSYIQMLKNLKSKVLPWLCKKKFYPKSKIHNLHLHICLSLQPHHTEVP